MRVLRACVCSLLVVVLAPLSVAGAASIKADKKCYVSGTAVNVAGSGFGPGNSIFVTGNQMFAAATADPGGIFSSRLRAPSLGAFIRPGSKSFKITATDQATNVTASTKIRVANLTFATSSGVKSPRSKRTWRFSGFIQKRGKPIYGHFRRAGKTYANYRFGKPKGACGTLTKRAPGIPAKNVRPGKWLIQVDYKKRYSRKTRPRVTSTTTVFTTIG